MDKDTDLWMARQRSKELEDENRRLRRGEPHVNGKWAAWIASVLAVLVVSFILGGLVMYRAVGVLENRIDYLEWYIYQRGEFPRRGGR